MLRSGPLLVGVMLVAGVVLGFLELRRPGWSQPIPSLGILLGILLALDLALQQVAARGRIDPLTMPFRFIAFLAAGVVLTAMPALLR